MGPHEEQLMREAGAHELHVTGRDVEEQELALSLKEGVWALIGDAKEYAISSERQEIIAVLRSSERAMTPSEVAKEVGKERTSVQHLITKMCEEGQLVRVKEKRGYYTLANTIHSPHSSHSQAQDEVTSAPNGDVHSDHSEGSESLSHRQPPEPVPPSTAVTDPLDSESTATRSNHSVNSLSDNDLHQGVNGVNTVNDDGGDFWDDIDREVEECRP
jgi:biotin operon repressor